MAEGPVKKSDRILRWSEVKHRVPISRSSAHAMAAEGKFPRPIKLGPRASGWLESEVLAWIEARVADSRAEKASKED